MCRLSDLLKAWYLFVVLGLVTFVLSSLVGSLPYPLTSAIAAPNILLYRASSNLRQVATNLQQRRDFEQEIAELKRQVAELEADNRQLEINLERYEQALSVSVFQAPGVVNTAPVIGVDPSPLIAAITLGKGSSGGIRPFMPVTSPAGLVGIVTDVVARSSNVRLISDPESRVGVTVEGKGGQGIAIGEVGGLVRVIDYFVDEPLEVGDQVETSSRGGLFPRGILVGEIIRVDPQDPNSLRQEFLVRPAVEVQNLLEVALIEPI
jgi:rod shape-determining protein MreC